ncbi:MAG: hypothetical protein Q9227_007771 [Pyrenula ochraceoflavens]
MAVTQAQLHLNDLVCYDASPFDNNCTQGDGPGLDRMYFVAEGPFFPINPYSAPYIGETYYILLPIFTGHLGGGSETMADGTNDPRVLQDLAVPVPAPLSKIRKPKWHIGDSYDPYVNKEFEHLSTLEIMSITFENSGTVYHMKSTDSYLANLPTLRIPEDELEEEYMRCWLHHCQAGELRR